MRPFYRRAAAGLAAAALLAGCSSASDPSQPLTAEADAQFPQLPPIPFAVDFQGDMPSELQTLLRPGRPERQPVGAARRPAGSRSASAPSQTCRRLQQALRAQGYFDGTVVFRIEDPQQAPAQGVVSEVERLATRPEAVVVYDVQTGPRYRFGALRVDLADNPDGFAAPKLGLGLVAGEPALTQSVLDAEQKLLADARQAGFALAKLGEREVIVDHETQLMDVTLRLDPGRRAEFGEVDFSGGDGVDFGFLRGRVPFAAGERYDPTLVEDSQKDLFDTNLFSTIVIRAGRRADRAGPARHRLRSAPAPAALDRRRAELRYRHRPRADGCSGSTATSSAPASGFGPKSPRPSCSSR